MQLASSPAFYEPPLAAMPQLSEKPRLGFESKKTAWNPGPNVCNSTVVLGLRAALVLEGVRKTYRARYYNPTTGRFLSEDPAGFGGSGPNLYAYAFDNPVDFNDPFGLSGTLTVFSSGTYGTGASGYFGSHSWISYTPDGGSATTYGTWGNNYGGANIGLNSNIEPIALAQGDWSDAVSRSQHLNDAQEAALMNFINSVHNQGTKGWSLGRPCSKFASDAWRAGTGEWLPDGSPTMPSSPAGLSQSINTANAANPSFGQIMSWMWSHMLFF